MNEAKKETPILDRIMTKINNEGAEFRESLAPPNDALKAHGARERLLAQLEKGVLTKDGIESELGNIPNEGEIKEGLQEMVVKSLIRFKRSEFESIISAE